jgi:hypothetical protein
MLAIRLPSLFDIKAPTDSSTGPESLSFETQLLQCSTESCQACSAGAGLFITVGRSTTPPEMQIPLGQLLTGAGGGGDADSVSFGTNSAALAVDLEGVFAVATFGDWDLLGNIGDVIGSFDSGEMDFVCGDSPTFVGSFLVDVGRWVGSDCVGALEGLVSICPPPGILNIFIDGHAIMATASTRNQT